MKDKTRYVTDLQSGSRKLYSIALDGHIFFNKDPVMLGYLIYYMISILRQYQELVDENAIHLMMMDTKLPSRVAISFKPTVGC